MMKERIQAARDDLPADKLKLIHSGKVLKDDQSVGDLGLTEADFIVCMVTKEMKVCNSCCFLAVAFHCISHVLLVPDVQK
ncbi:hypothetical protein EON64_08805, partial [archaeon]